MQSASTEVTRPSRAETKAQTRLSLMSAARDVFLSVGYHGATLDQIAARAGFTKGALYWHFPNKQAIFLALVADAIENNIYILDRLLDPDVSKPDEIKAHLGCWINGIDEREVLPSFGVELEIEARHDPSFRALHQTLIGKHESALARFLGRYFGSIGETPPMPVAELAPTLITIFKGFALVRQNRPDQPATSARVTKMLLNIPEECGTPAS